MFVRFYFAILMVFGFSSNAQNANTTLTKNYRAIDKKMSEVKDSFTSIPELGNYISSAFSTEEEKCRAIYYWVAKTIEYDVKSMYAINLKETHKDIIAKTFTTKKAICMGYALLFDSLCTLTNITCEYVTGSTRQDWFPEPTGHAWNAVKINQTWYLVDATWGSGYIEDRRFIRALSNKYFLADGKTFYPSYHPIDAIWQLLEYPHDLFYFYNQSKTKTASVKWNYTDSIEAHLKRSEIDKIIATQRRLKLNGTNSNFTSDYYIYLENKKTAYFAKEFNKVTKRLNQIVNTYNSYNNLRNNKFEPAISDSLLKHTFDESTIYLKESEGVLNQLKKYNVPDLSENIVDVNIKIKDLQTLIERENKVIETHLSKKSKKRK